MCVIILVVFFLAGGLDLGALGEHEIDGGARFARRVEKASSTCGRIVGHAGISAAILLLDWSFFLLVGLTQVMDSLRE